LPRIRSSASCGTEQSKHQDTKGATARARTKSELRSQSAECRIADTGRRNPRPELHHQDTKRRGRRQKSDCRMQSAECGQQTRSSERTSADYTDGADEDSEPRRHEEHEGFGESKTQNPKPVVTLNVVCCVLAGVVLGTGSRRGRTRDEGLSKRGKKESPESDFVLVTFPLLCPWSLLLCNFVL